MSSTPMESWRMARTPTQPAGHPHDRRHRRRPRPRPAGGGLVPARPDALVAKVATWPRHRRGPGGAVPGSRSLSKSPGGLGLHPRPLDAPGQAGVSGAYAAGNTRRAGLPLARSRLRRRRPVNAAPGGPDQRRHAPGASGRNVVGERTWTRLRPRRRQDARARADLGRPRGFIVSADQLSGRSRPLATTSTWSG